MKRSIPAASVLVTVIILSGCMVGPHYKRPAANTPPAYRDVDSVSGKSDPSTSSVGDLKWSEVFQDEQLKALIAEALDKNYDVRIAAQRVLEQQAQVGVTRSQSLPSLNGGAAYSAIGLPSGLLGNSSSPQFNGGGFTASAAWNLDFWGLYRRQNEAERAQLLATEWGRRATLSSIVIQVATSYIQMRTLDAQLEITRGTLESRRESLRLVSLRERVGSTTMADVRQAEQLLYGAEAVLPDLERQIREQENNLSLLLGRNPGPIPRGKRNIEQPHPQEVPAGIPSELLERRPDIQRAEAQLIAANARIGVARAQFFPQMSITGLGGTATRSVQQALHFREQLLAGGGQYQRTYLHGRQTEEQSEAGGSNQAGDGAGIPAGNRWCLPRCLQCVDLVSEIDGEPHLAGEGGHRRKRVRAACALPLRQRQNQLSRGPYE